MNRTLHLFIIIFLVLTACTISPDKRFIGAWIETSRPGGTVTFKNDGTLTIGSKETTFIGTWEITKENLFNMLIIVDGEEIKYLSDKFTFNGKDEFTILSKTKEFVFKRKK